MPLSHVVSADTCVCHPWLGVSCFVFAGPLRSQPSGEWEGGSCPPPHRWEGCLLTRVGRAHRFSCGVFLESKRLSLRRLPLSSFGGRAGVFGVIVVMVICTQ